MKKVSLNYPFPVLNDSNDDFREDCSFNIELSDPYESGEDFVLPFRYDLKCPSLEDMIHKGEAVVVLQLESPETQYRKAITFSGDNVYLEHIVSKSELGSVINVKGFIISMEEIYPYQPPERNMELFENIPFKVNKNDFLAVSNDKFSIPVDSYDPLADRPSIFSVRKSNREEEIEIDYSQSRITIWINNELHQIYKKYYEAPENRVILASFFAVPALEDVISMMKESSQQQLEQDYGACKWYQVIKHKLRELKIDIYKEDSIIKIANRLLPHIFKTNLESFGNMYDQYNSGKDE